MKTVTLTLKFNYYESGDEEVPQMSAHHLRFLICDAFAEFKGHRGPTPEAYVAERYPLPGYQWLDREKKVEETRLRCKMAEFLRNGAAGMTSLTLDVGEGEEA